MNYIYPNTTPKFRPKHLMLLLFAWMLPLSGAVASHIVGGEISYRCLGGNEFEITLHVYRDCINGLPGAPFDDPASVGIFRGKNGPLLYDLRIPFAGDDTLEVNLQSECLAVPGPVCVHTSTYVDTVKLVSWPQGYTIAYQRCCRNITLQNIVDPYFTGATFSVYVPPVAINECNNSPAFQEWPPVYICQNEPLNFDHSAVDEDGDLLVYSLCTPQSGATFNQPMPQPPAGPPYDTVVWVAPTYSLDQILGPSPDPLSIDPQTGLITGVPQIQGQFVVGVCVEEYDKNTGELKSTVRRDFQYNVGLCVPTTAAFFAPDTQCDDLTVSFENQSNGGSTYQWYFDYPNTDLASNEEDPSFTFPDTGTYTVALIVAPNDICPDTAFREITLSYSGIDADFEIVPQGCDGSTQLVLTDLSIDSLSTIESWSWTVTYDNGNESQTSTAQNPVFTLPVGASGTVMLTVTSANGCDQTVSQDFVLANGGPSGPVILSCPQDLDLGCLPDSIPAATPGEVQLEGSGEGVVILVEETLTENECLATIERLYIAEDSCGLRDTCTQLITYGTDDEAPVITCPDDMEVSCDELPILIDFNDQQTGSTASEITTSAGVVKIFGVNKKFPGQNAAMIFDGSNPTGDDPDLGSPNVDFGGPGIGKAGGAGSAFAHYKALGKSLIVSEDLDASDPDDNAKGGELIFDFSDMGVVTVHSIDLIDCEKADKVTLYDSLDQVITTFTPIESGDNGLQTLSLENHAGVAKLVVFLPSSGSIDNLLFSSELVFDFATATDNCTDDPNITFVDVVTDSLCGGGYTIERTYRATDDCGNFSECVQLITVTDTEAPEIQNCPSDTLLAECNPVIPEPVTIFATDNCDPEPEITMEETEEMEGCEVILTRLYIARDACGNADSCSQEIRYTVDTIPPEITFCPEDLDLASGEIPGPLDTFAITATDECGEVSYSAAQTVICINDQLSVRRTYYAEDECGNVDSCVQIITTTFLCPDPNDGCIVQDLDLGCNPDTIPEPSILAPPGYVTIYMGEDTLVDGCMTTLVRSFELLNPMNEVEDTCLQEIFWTSDTELPVITSCPADTSVCYGDPVPGPDISAWAYTDNCGIADTSITTVVDSLSSSDTTYITYTYTVVDNCGNADSCSQTVFVLYTSDCDPDTEPCEDYVIDILNPEAIDNMPDIAPCNDLPIAPDLYFLDVLGDSAVATVEVSIAGDSCFGNALYTWTATEDSCGVTETFTKFVFFDPVIPAFDAPGDTAVSCVSLPILPSVIGYDNGETGFCAINGADTSSLTLVQGTADCPEVYEETWETIVCDDTLRASRLITIDGADLSIACPADTFIFDPFAPVPPIDTNAVTVSGACSNTTITVSEAVDTFCFLQTITIERTYTVTDACGNTTSCTQRIEQFFPCGDPEPYVCPDFDIDLGCNPPIIPAPFFPDTTVKEGILVAEDTIVNGCDFTLVRQYEVISLTDVVLDTCEQLVSWRVDTDAPVIASCPGDTTILTDTIPGIDSTLWIADDACGIVLTSFDDQVDTVACQGIVVTRTFTATDICGNSSSCEQVITLPNAGLPCPTPPDTLYACVGDTIELNPGADTSSLCDYAWDASDILADTTLLNPTWVVTDTMTFEVTITDTSGCAYTRSVTVIAEGPVGLEFEAQQDCDTTLVTFTPNLPALDSLWWDFGDNATAGDTSMEMMPEYTYPDTGSYVVSLTAWLDGCAYTISDTISVGSPLEIGYDGDYVNCDLDSIVLSLSDQSVSPNAPITQWEWWIGGDTLSGPDQEVVLTESDTVQLTYIVTNADGCTDTLSEDILVTLPTFNSPDTVILCPGDTIQLNPGGDQPNTFYSWNPVNGFISAANVASPLVSPDQTTTYTLIVYAAGTLDTCVANFNVTVLVAEEIGLVSPGAAVTTCSDTVDLSVSATQPVTFTWYDTSGNVVGMGADVSLPAPDSSGQYIVTSTDQYGCSETDTIEVLNLKVEAEFFNGASAGACPGDTSVLAVNNQNPGDTLSLAWTQSPYIVGYDSEGNALVVGPEGTTNFSVEVSNQHGCVETLNLELTTASYFDALTLNDTFNVCEGEPQVLQTGGDTSWTYSWSPGTFLDDSTSAMPVFTGDSDMTYTITVGQLVSGVTCDTNITTTVLVDPALNLTVTPDNPVLCAPEEVILTANADQPATILWSSNDNFTDTLSTVEELMVMPQQTTSYFVSVEGGACAEKQEVVITLGGINASLLVPDTLCDPVVVDLEVEDMSDGQMLTYDWYPKEALDGPDSMATAQMDPTVTTDYSVIVTNQYGCLDTLSGSTFVITLSDSVTAMVDPDTIDPGEMAQLTAVGCVGCTFSWSPADQIDGPTDIPNPTAAPDDDMVYTVMVSQSGCTGMDTTLLVVRDLDQFCTSEGIYLPNTFTPNGDGLNDIFRVRSKIIDSGQVEEFEFMVYSRWGQQMFRTNDPNAGWDGTYNGTLVEPGTYGYYARIVCIGGAEVEKKGNINVMR